MISLKGLTQGKKETPENVPKANIFNKSLAVKKEQNENRSLYMESKKKKQAYITIGISALALATYSIMFFYGSVSAYLSAPAEISSYIDENNQYEEVTLPSLEKTRDMHKASYDKQFEEAILAIDTVFPEGVDKLGFVKLLESFATEVAASFPPFEFTSISLSSPIEENGYVIVPASTSIHSSLAGFDKFLSLVDQSGYIYTGEGEDKKVVNKKIRLMSISNVSVKYRGVDEKTGKDEGVDFSVKLNIYSRPESK